MEEPKSAEIVLHPSAKGWPALACLEAARQRMPRDCATALVVWYDGAGDVRFNLTGTNKDIAWMLARVKQRWQAQCCR